MIARVLILVFGFLLSQVGNVSASTLSSGPDLGWSFRQFAFVPQGGVQVDMVSHYVTLGAFVEYEVVPAWLSLRGRGSVDIQEHMEFQGEVQPGTFSQHGLTAEGLAVGSFAFTDGISGSVGTGLTFVHYLPDDIRGENPDGVKGIPQQQALQIPLLLGLRIETEGIVVLPELGAGYAVFYDSVAPDVNAGLRDGTVEALNLDVWLRLGLSFPVL